MSESPLVARPRSVVGVLLRAGRYTLGHVALVGLLAISAAVGLAIVLLRPPALDIWILAISLTLSGVLSLSLGWLAMTYGRRLRPRLAVQMGLAITIGVLVALINVAVTAGLMFLSSHDQTLLFLLLGFSLLISLAFGLYLAEETASAIRGLAAGARQLADGDLAVRVDPPASEELGDLALAFNQMASHVETSFRRLQEMEQSRTQLIAAVSHDLRTPLASLRAMVEALADGVVDDPVTVRRYLQTMRGDIAHLSMLIADLFELSQIEAGGLRLQRRLMPVQELLTAAVQGGEARAELRSLTLSHDPVAAEQVAWADGARLQRVLANLVDNAIRHTPAGGAIRLAARSFGDEVEIAVTDTGEGIAPHNLPHVFQRFYRGDPARTREQAGAGLGLTIARELVEAHGGRIWAESAAGQGTTIRFTLPASGGSEAGRADSASLPPTGPT